MSSVGGLVGLVSLAPGVLVLPQQCVPTVMTLRPPIPSYWVYLRASALLVNSHASSASHSPECSVHSTEIMRPYNLLWSLATAASLKPFVGARSEDFPVGISLRHTEL